ncbi:MAG: putative lipid II flippase FtsW [Bacillota bacterium]
MEGDNKSFDFPMLIIVLILIMVGLIMIMSASSIRAYNVHGKAHYFFQRQLLFSFVGLLGMYILSRVDYHYYYKLSKIILFVGFFLLVLVLFPGIGRSAGGARRWIPLGFFGLQPSELAKLSIIIYISSFISRKRESIKDFKQGILPVLIVVIIFSVLIIQQPDMGTSVNIVGIAFLLLLIGGMKFKHFVFISTSGFLVSLYYIYSAAYRLNRVKTFLDPWKDPRGSGYHIIQSLLALGSGGLTGIGPGNSRQKFLYLPEPGTDFIFAILGEEFGLIGTLFVLILFGSLAYRGILIALNAPDLFGSLMAIGIITMLVIQVIINIGAVTSLLPVTGITLPFISYGGSSLLVSLFGIGIMLNISRQSE